MIGRTKMHYLYIGYYVDESTFSEILEKGINNMSVARQKLEYNLIRGLYENLKQDISFISYVPTDGRITIPDYSKIDEAIIKHINIKKNSVSSVKESYSSFKRYLLGLGKNKLRNLCVLMYAVIPPFEQVLLNLRKRYGFKIVTICSEVPKLRRYSNSIPSKLKKALLTFYNEQFDGYVFLSEAMKEVVNIKSKPYIVMEGIACDRGIQIKADRKNIVMYAGGLAKDNNIPLLIKCCLKLESLHEIWVCGTGSDRDTIIELAKKDSRVKYFGMIPNDDVLKMEEQAKVLVNFRNPNAELTKYSFPSKILEYIESGCVVVSTRLEGIPSEYFDYIIPIENIDETNIINTLDRVMQMEDAEYCSICKKAKDFINTEKDYLQQSKRIIAFLENL